MKMTNHAMIQLLNAFTEIVEALLDTSIPIKMAYAMKKNLNVFIAEYTPYEELLNLLKEKYNIIGDEVGPAEYNKELAELLSIEIDLKFHMIEEETLLANDFNITPKQLGVLEFMIKPNERKTDES